MTELLTSDQMRAIEGAAIASGQVAGLELMERAGRGVMEAIFEHWPEYAKSPRRAVILCGPGNNGGDGFVVARLLAEQHWEVEVFLYGDQTKLPPDAKTNCERWLEMGTVEPLTERGFRKKRPAHGHAYADIYLDALFGTGLTRAVEGDTLDVLRHMAGTHGENYTPGIVSVDAPSGLCMDSGKVLATKLPEPQIPPEELKLSPDFVQQGSRGSVPYSSRFAALTVAFDSPKVGHFIGDGPSLCGKLIVKDIGLEGWRCLQPREGQYAEEPERICREGAETGVARPPTLRLVTAKPIVPDRRDFMRNTFSALGYNSPNRSDNTHKFDRGHALVLSGPAGHTGAARLAARGALRIGAGLVTVAAPGPAIPECASQLTAIMLRQCDGADDLRDLLEDKRLNALCLGPGLGVGERTRALVGAALVAKRQTVLDADALTSFAADPDNLFGLLHKNCILTPHMGEFARLFPDLSEKLAELPVSGPAFSKVDATRAAAERAGCTVLLKGPDTVIAEPSGISAVHAAHYDRGAPWLATAGAGDVLAGFIAGLLARGSSLRSSAETAAWLHVECARAFGPGLIAEDLPEMLPQVLMEVLG